MKKFILVLIVSIFTGFVYTTEIVQLPGHAKPSYLAVDKTQLYISDFPQIYIYSLKDFSLLKKFGKRGEGPMEFQNYANITLVKDKIIINSVGKMSFFSKQGVFIREKKLGLLGSAFKPFGSHYGVYGVTQQDKINYQTLSVYDSDFKKVKELYRYPSFFQPDGPKRGVYVVDFARFGMLVYENYMIFQDMEDFIVYVWHEQENNRVSIKQDYKKKKFTAKDKERYHHFFKTDPGLKVNYQNFKPLLKFPAYFPAIRGFGVGDGKIFVYTFKEKEGRSEFFIFDMTGKLLKTTYLPLKGGMAHYQNPYFFSGWKMYQLVENDDDEEWDLHITEIK